MFKVLIFIIIKLLYPYPLVAQEVHTESEVVTDDRLFYDESEFHDRLHRLLIASQRQYLNNEFEKAIDTLKEIVDMRLLYDWRSDKRAIIANSYIRLIELDVDNQDFWIKEFVSFGGSSGVDADSAFSSELISKINTKAEQVKAEAKKYYAENLPENVEYMKINGEKIYLVDAAIDVFDWSTYRVTLYFKDGKEKTKILTGKELLNYNWKNNKYESGDVIPTKPISDNNEEYLDLDKKAKTKKVVKFMKKNWKTFTLSGILTSFILYKGFGSAGRKSKTRTISVLR